MVNYEKDEIVTDHLNSIQGPLESEDSEHLACTQNMNGGLNED